MSKYDFTIDKNTLTVDPHSVHSQIINLVRESSRALDIGCSTGYIAKYLSEEKKCKVTGIELNQESALKAQKYCEKVIVGNIEDEKIFTHTTEKFDVIILADVLEHLVEPYNVLIRLKGILNKNGSILLSLPNIAYWRIRLNLLFGRFDYTEEGIMDRTHLKFFTCKTAKELIETVGYQIKYFSGAGGFGPLFLKKLFPSLFAAQFVFEICPRHYS